MPETGRSGMVNRGNPRSFWTRMRCEEVHKVFLSAGPWQKSGGGPHKVRFDPRMIEHDYMDARDRSVATGGEHYRGSGPLFTERVPVIGHKEKRLGQVAGIQPESTLLRFNPYRAVIVL